MRLTGAITLVTGASSGIGAATATALGAAGARLLLTGRDAARLAEVARQTGGVALPADLAAPGAPARLAEAVFQAVQTAPWEQPGPGKDGIDVLVNNAGLGWAGPLGDIPAAKITELIAVNLAAPMELTKLLLPGMIKRGRGRVVFVPRSLASPASAVRRCTPPPRRAWPPSRKASPTRCATTVSG